MPAGRPSTYDPGLIPQILGLAKKGKSLAQISAAIDVPRSTMHSWAERHDEFSATLTRAKELEQAWWEETAQTAMFADKFNSAVWAKSMSARFRDEYTERKDLTHEGGLMINVIERFGSDNDSE